MRHCRAFIQRESTLGGSPSHLKRHAGPHQREEPQKVVGDGQAGVRLDHHRVVVHRDSRMLDRLLGSAGKQLPQMVTRLLILEIRFLALRRRSPTRARALDPGPTGHGAPDLVLRREKVGGRCLHLQRRIDRGFGAGQIEEHDRTQPGVRPIDKLDRPLDDQVGRHRPRQTGVLGLVDLAHAATAQLGNEVVVSDLLPDHQTVDPGRRPGVSLEEGAILLHRPLFAFAGEGVPFCRCPRTHNHRPNTPSARTRGGCTPDATTLRPRPGSSGADSLTARRST